MLLHRIFAVAVLFFMAGCHEQTASNDTVCIFAAASTSQAVEEICDRFEDQTGLKTRLSFASSATLANQILNGAPADLFLSANLEWGDKLIEFGKAKELRTIFGNRLVGVCPESDDNSWVPKKLSDLADDRIGKIAIADADSVPAGIYAKRAMVHVGIWEDVRDKLVYGANVRQSLAMVESGAVDIGLIYKTDTAIATKVKMVFEVDSKASGPIHYAIARTNKGEHNSAANKIMEFMDSEIGASIFAKHGFVISVQGE